MDIVTTILAALSAVFAGIAAFAPMIKNRVHLNVDINKDESFFFTGLESANGSRESLILSGTIANTSTQPVTITEICMHFGDHIESPSTNESKIPYPGFYDHSDRVTKGPDGNVILWVRTGDGMYALDLEKDLIRTPLTLGGGEAVKGLILFTVAGASSGAEQDIVLKFKTGRKTVTIKEKVKSRRAAYRKIGE